MKALLLVASTVIVLAVAAPAQAICVNCFELRCSSSSGGYVNCMSNGSRCSRWTTCTGDSDGGGCGTADNPPCEQGVRRSATQWRLASVEVRPAPKLDVRWRLASVETFHAPAAPVTP
jgi:hypothetical protein